MNAADTLDAVAYAADPTLFWLWPRRWDDTPMNRASQKYEPFWNYIPRALDIIYIQPGDDNQFDSLGFTPTTSDEVELWTRSKSQGDRGIGRVDRSFSLLGRCKGETTFATADLALENTSDRSFAFECGSCGRYHLGSFQ